MQEPTDAIVRLTASAICGTDLHMIEQRPRKGRAVLIQERTKCHRNRDRTAAAGNRGRRAFNRAGLGGTVAGQGRTLSIVGVYPPTARHFPIGNAMNKNLKIHSGNCNHRAYIPKLVELVRAGAIQPYRVLPQIGPPNALEAYKNFDKREAGWIKVMLQPSLESTRAA